MASVRTPKKELTLAPFNTDSRSRHVSEPVASIELIVVDMWQVAPPGTCTAHLWFLLKCVQHGSVTSL
jgi:hypothetical protein